MKKIVSAAIRQHRATGRLIKFHIQLSHNSQYNSSATALLNRCWDGLRVLPYELSEIINSVSLTAALLIARSEETAGIDDWPERLWGETELIDIAPIGGHLEAAPVCKADLIAAMTDVHHGALTASMRRLAEEQPIELMDYVLEPWLLFDFLAFKKLFVEQFVPMTVDAHWKVDLEEYEGALKSMWSASFNPAFVAFVTNAKYRFLSPLGLEPDIDHVIYVTPDMEYDDFEEVFDSSLPSILSHGLPFYVRFTGYNFDERELWDIDHVVEQCKLIVKASGLSVLKVTTIFEDRSNSSGIPAGFGAFEISTIALKQVKDIQGQTMELLRPRFDALLEELQVANYNLELRAKSRPDWPGDLEE